MLAKSILLKRISDSHPDHVCLDKLYSLLADRKVPPRAPRGPRGSWLVLPFHRGLEKNRLNVALNRCSVMWEQAGLSRFKPSISWRMHGNNLAQIVAADAKRKALLCV
jgi:hypothetical protein